jgi:hypothetical protein
MRNFMTKRAVILAAERFACCRKKSASLTAIASGGQQHKRPDPGKQQRKRYHKSALQTFQQ